MRLELQMGMPGGPITPVSRRKGYTTSGVIKTEIDQNLSVEYRLASSVFLQENGPSNYGNPQKSGAFIDDGVYVQSGLHPAVQPFIALYHTFTHSDPGELADKFGSESIRHASVGHRQNIIVAATLQYAAQILRISEFKDLVTQFKADGIYQDHIHGKIIEGITNDKSTTAIVLHEERATGFYSGVMEERVLGHHGNKWVRSSRARESIECATGTFDPFVTRADRVYREIRNDKILSTDLDAVAEAVERMKPLVGTTFTADYNLSRLLYLCSERAPDAVEFGEGTTVGENEVTLTRQAGKFFKSLSLRLSHRQVKEKRNLEKTLPLLESPQVDEVKYLPKLESALELAQRHIEDGTTVLGWMNSTLSALESGAELPQLIGYQSDKEGDSQTNLTDSVRARIDELSGILTRRPDRLDKILTAVKAREMLEDLGCNTNEITSKIHTMSRGENDQRKESLSQPHLLEDVR
jgi:hypothetical protein